MADQKDQDPGSPVEDPTFLPLKNRAMAEKSLPGFSREPESSDSSGEDEDMVESFGKEFKKQKLEQLQRKAYYSVLYAFKAEISTLSYKRSQIIRKLMNEWNIAHETYISVADNIEKDLLAPQHLTSTSEAKEMQTVDNMPSTNSEKKKTLSPTFVPKSGSSWGSVNPESLVGKWVRVRLPEEEGFEEFFIKEYDAKQEMHRLENTDSNAMEMDAFLSWMDLREIPPNDIMWQGGEPPNFGVPNKSRAQRALF